MDKVEQSQKEINEVVNMMKVNCEKMLERGEKMNSLQQLSKVGARKPANENENIYLPGTLSTSLPK